MKNINQLIEVKNYLSQNENRGVEAFKSLFEKSNKESAEFVVLSFTYENIEAYLKINNNFELGEDMFGVLSQSQLDKLSGYKYNDENLFEDYEYWKFQELVWSLIEVWIVNCYEIANGKYENNVKFYFKQNHDSLEILELNNCNIKFEKSEFDIYIQNNKRNTLELLS